MSYCIIFKECSLCCKLLFHSLMLVCSTMDPDSRFSTHGRRPRYTDRLSAERICHTFSLHYLHFVCFFRIVARASCQMNMTPHLPVFVIFLLVMTCCLESGHSPRQILKPSVMVKWLKPQPLFCKLVWEKRRE